MKQSVKSHTRWRKGKKVNVDRYSRTKRKKNVRVRVMKKPVKLYPRVDAYGRRKGFSSKPGKFVKLY